MQRRRGAAVVGAAIISSLLGLLTLGVLECGAWLLVKQKATQATQTGARYGADRDSTFTLIEAKVQEAFWGIVPYTSIPESDRDKVHITVSNPSEPGQPVVVRVHCDFKDFAPFPPFIEASIDAESTYRKEA